MRERQKNIVDPCARLMLSPKPVYTSLWQSTKLICKETITVRYKYKYNAMKIHCDSIGFAFSITSISKSKNTCKQQSAFSTSTKLASLFSVASHLVHAHRYQFRFYMLMEIHQNNFYFISFGERLLSVKRCQFCHEFALTKRYFSICSLHNINFGGLFTRFHINMRP